MGSLIHLIVINLFMEEFEINTINSACHPPKLWLRIVDDTIVIHKAENCSKFLHHINSIDPHTQFTQETPDTEGSIPYLDTLVSPGLDNTLLNTVYRKPTYTDQCLHRDSNHSLSAKYIVFKSVTHRLRTDFTNPQPLHKEEEHIKALTRCKYPT